LASVEDYELVRLWDLATGKSIATLGKPLAPEWTSAGQSPAPEWRPRLQPGGRVVGLTRISDARPVTFFPIAPAGTGMEPLPDGRTWYGFEDTHLAIYRLEGEPGPE
jgi:hypothetical protein